MVRYHWVVAAAVLAAGVGWVCGQPGPPDGPVPAARTEAVILPQGVTQSVAMKARKPIKTVQQTDDTVLRMSADDRDRNVVLVTGASPGVSRVTITAIDGAEETVAVAVERPETARVGSRAARTDVVRGLQDALKNESSAGTRLILADALIRFAPTDAVAAQELVKALTSDDGTLPADAYGTIERLMPTAPPALVAALVPVLRHKEEIHRRRAAVLLSRVDVKAVP